MLRTVEDAFDQWRYVHEKNSLPWTSLDFLEQLGKHAYNYTLTLVPP